VLACNTVLVQTSTKTYALDRSDGTTLWEASPGNQFAEPLSDGRSVFVASGAPTALDLRDGTVTWSHDLTDVTPWGCCLGNGILVVTGPTDGGGAVVGLDAASGDRRWRTDLSRVVKAAPTYRDGTVYVPDEGAQLVALTTDTGDVEWRTRPYDSIPGDRRATTPTVADDTVIVPSGNGGTTAAVDRANGEMAWELETARRWPRRSSPKAAQSSAR
jgi:outer membrane protein assembly factor BamB